MRAPCFSSRDIKIVFVAESAFMRNKLLYSSVSLMIVNILVMKVMNENCNFVLQNKNYRQAFQSGMHHLAPGCLRYKITLTTIIIVR